MSRSLHPHARILNHCIGALTGFSHLSHPDGLNNTASLKAESLKVAPTVVNSGQNVLSKNREGREEPPITWVQLSGQLATATSW